MNEFDLLARYRRYIRNRLLFILLVMAGIAVTGVIAIASGAAGIGIGDVLSVFFGEPDRATSQIVMQIRMPRVLAALLAGFALSASGAVMQSILRNPLASPFTLGISGAAAFGAAFAIVVLGAGSTADLTATLSDTTASTRTGLLAQLGDRYLVMGSAFAWSMTSTFFILAIARYRGVTPEVMVLAGIAIGSLFSAGVSAMQYLATEAELAAIVFWMFGDLGRAAWQEVWLLALVLIPVWLFFTMMSWNYKALQSGDEFAQSLGVNPFRIRLYGMLVASLATAVVVSFYGIIAFVGLVVPHIVRRFIGGDETFLIPAAALFGALFLLLSDTVARTLFSPVILPVGILTSFIGAPLFLFLLLRGFGKNYWN
ncbi:MAG: iron ABC transporter permease [Cyclonatronaceae bacterium]